MATSPYRSCSAGETFDRVSPFLSRLGITRLSRQTDLDCVGIPVWCAFTPNARAIVIAQGKGMDDDAARTSAAMEAVERSVATQPACPVVNDSLLGLETAGVRADPLDCLIAAGEKPLMRDERRDWVAARDLLGNHPVYLPFDAVHLDRTRDGMRFWQSSDGLASGNTRDETVLHGLLERVERDALTLWQMTPISRRYARRIDATSLESAELQLMLDRIVAAGLAIALFDITTDLGIPSVTAVLGPTVQNGFAPIRHVDVTLGCGAALSPFVAAGRAITEAVQSRMTFIAGARDDLLPQMFDEPVSAQTMAAFDSAPAVLLAELPQLAAETTAKALALLVSQLASKRIDRLYAVDLAPDWLPAFVVKVIAPQLENPDGDRRQRFGARALSRAFA